MVIRAEDVRKWQETFQPGGSDTILLFRDNKFVRTTLNNLTSSIIGIFSPLGVENGGTGSTGDVVTVAANYTIKTTDKTIKCTGDVALTVTAPSASSVTGQDYNIKNMTTQTVRLALVNSQKIDGVSFIDILPGVVGAYPNLRIQSDGVGYIII